MKNEFDDLEQFDDLIAEVKAAGEVPEPSPLFWNHLSARVRDAVAAEPIARSWWSLYWRPVATAAATFSFIAIIVWSVRAPEAPVVADSAISSAASGRELVADVAVSEMWRMIEMASPNVELDTAQEAGLMPTPYAADQAIEDLSPAQREALVRLLRKEMGVTE
jgi:hypothetical protein